MLKAIGRWSVFRTDFVAALTGGAALAALAASAAAQPVMPAAKPTPAGTRVVKDGTTCVGEMVPMRDGTRLYTEVYLPAGSETASPLKRPVILVRSPYGATGLMEGCFVAPTGAAGLVPLGFIAVIQSVRGTGSSDGTFVPVVNERDDGHDLIKWVMEQPWSNGRVGMTSGSYLGWTQWQAAVDAPPGLKAISPTVSSGNGYDDGFMRNGVVDPFFQSWAQQFVPQIMSKEMKARGVPAAEIATATQAYQARSKANKEWIETLPLTGDWDAQTRQYAPFIWSQYAHPTYDAFWRKLDVNVQVGKITVPAFVGGSWYDYFTKGTIDTYLALVAKGGSPAARTRSMLAMDCCGHSPSYPTPKQPGEIDWGPNRLNYNALRDKFLLEQVGGKDSALAGEAPVQIAVLVPPDRGLKGDTFIYKTNAWPVPGSQTVRYHLASGGKANTLAGDGVLTTDGRSRGPADSFAYDPKNPVPTLGFGATGAAVDQMICPLQSGPKSLLFWIMKEFGNGQEAQAGRDYRQAA